jgi:site-specific DNA-methyltransferase (adenine-specific)/adenine-specific DNA-methyltransferase
MQLDDELKRELIARIEKNERIPETFKNLLFPPKEEPKEIELKYGMKEREEDILADTMAMPFQPVMQFGKISDEDWNNMLISGDNLQALKFLLKLKYDGKLKNKDGTEGVKLVYIDPPFATTQDFSGRNGEKAYSDKLSGAEFVEFLRKRLIFLREILSDNGSIYIHLDEKRSHYVKVVLDEVFRSGKFQREIIWRIGWISGYKSKASNWIRNHDVILYYTKNPNEFIFNKQYIKYPKGYKRRDGVEPEGEGYPIEDTWDSNEIDQMPSIQIMSLSKEKTGFPTQKNENLLERIIRASSNQGDIVLDCFAGSGTTAAVAEKLKRNWICVDSSKFSIYTIIKRLHTLREEIGNKGNTLKPKPFIFYNAGLYEDHDFILKMGEENFKRFAIDLFQAESKNFDINGLKMDGVLLNCPVKVFSQEGYLTEEYIDQLHSTVGEYIKARMFIIAPASRVFFLQDYIEKDGVRYYVLRIPYSVIDELHKKTFTRPLQPSSLKEINQNIEQVGFDFIHPPNVQAEYYIRKPKDKLVEEELVVEIKEFEAVQRAKDPMNFENPKDALSMMLVDKDYNGEYFNMTDYLFADQIKKENYKARLSASGIGKKIAIIYLDIFGNERIEVKGIKEFKRE